MQYISDFFSGYALTALLCGAAAYLLGSVNFAIIVSAALKRKDIRSCGSGNPGATNMMRSYGTAAGLITFAGDLLKAFAAVMLAGAIAHALTPGGEQTEVIRYLSGLCCMLGHTFPLFFQFKGGKGVSASLGAGLALDWRFGLICFGVFVIVVLIWRFVSLGSIAGICCAPLLNALLPYNGRSTATAVITVSICCLMALLVTLRHKANIKRIRSGTENRFSFKHSAH